MDTEPVTVAGDVYGWHVVGLKPATSYTFKIEAGDQAGNWSVNGPAVSVVTPPAADVIPPVWPVGSKLEVTGVTSTEALLSWTEAEDESGIAGYRIYNGVNPLPLTVVAGDPLLTVTQTVYTPAVTEAVYGGGSVTQAVQLPGDGAYPGDGICVYGSSGGYRWELDGKWTLHKSGYSVRSG